MLFLRCLWANKVALVTAMAFIGFTLMGWFGPAYFQAPAIAFAIGSGLMFALVGDAGMTTLHAYRDVRDEFCTHGCLRRVFTRVARVKYERMYCYRVGAELALKDFSVPYGEAALLRPT